MELLREITEETLNLKERSPQPIGYKERSAARAVVLDKGKIALMYVGKHKFYKIPGGGVEDGETLEQALRREVLEESGCEISILGELGIIVEKRIHRTKVERDSLLQTSYCYLVEKTGDTKKQKLTKSEKKADFKLIWVTLNEAIRLVKEEKPQTYEGLFVQQRELSILQKADELLNHARC